MAALIVATTTLTVNNCNAQSFMEKTKAKAKAKLDVKAKASITTNQESTTGIKKPVSAKSEKGTYHLLEAERLPAGGTTKTLAITVDKYPNTEEKVLVITACPKGCASGVYNYKEELSTELGINVYFISAGIYVMQYDDNSYVSVMPSQKEVLGVMPFNKFAFTNFYSTDALKVKGMTKVKAEAYAVKMSKKILAPSTAAPSKGGNGLYHCAIQISNARKPYSKLQLTYTTKDSRKIIKMKYGDNGATDTYEYMNEFSKVIGKDVYKNDLYHYQKYIFIDKPGVIYYTRYLVQDLGYAEWEDINPLNMFAMDKQFARSLRGDANLQKEITDKIIAWTKKIKENTAKKDDNKIQDIIDKQRLQKEGLVDNSLKEQTLEAAKNWATKWNWKETITNAYFTGTDWYIVRHKNSGVILRRSINGVMVLKRPDGMCSFHKCVYGQQYDGSKYNKVYTVGITPGQLKLDCKYTK